MRLGKARSSKQNMYYCLTYSVIGLIILSIAPIIKMLSIIAKEKIQQAFNFWL